MMRPPGQFREVEGVQRLPALHQDVIGNVDDVVDRQQSDRLEAVRHPVGAGSDLRPADEPRGIAEAQVGALDVHP